MNHNCENHTFYLPGHLVYNEATCCRCIWALSAEKEILYADPTSFTNMLLKPFNEMAWDDATFTEVVENKNPKLEVKKHYQRMINADLSYPILITKHNGKYEICDGCHRYIKSVILNKQISYRII